MFKIAVVSGKGGVGKTTIALAIARALAEEYKVGLLDVDITGSNSHLQLKILKNFTIKKETIHPAIAEIDGKKIEYLSIALVSESYVYWSGDVIKDFVNQIIRSTAWNCEYLIFDAPPGVHEDSIRAIELSDVVIFVTIPAKFAALDLERTINLTAELEKPAAGVYVNFADAVCPHCGKALQLFKHNINLNLPVIQYIPFTYDNKVEVSLDALMHFINNPIKLKKVTVADEVKRNLLKIILKGLAKLGGG